MILEYLSHCLKEVSIDCVILGFDGSSLKVLVSKWRNIEYWSLPGGRIKKMEALDDAAQRILEERVGLGDVFLRQFHVFGAVNRYRYYEEAETLRLIEQAIAEDFSKIQIPSRVLSVGYYALVDINKTKAIPDEYTDECRWMELGEIPHLLFDHNEMIDLAIQTLRKEIKYQPIGNLLPPKFTMAEIQKLYESILGRTFDRRNFHKQISKQDFLVKLNEKRTGLANKAPTLYCIDQVRYDSALEEGMGF